MPGTYKVSGGLVTSQNAEAAHEVASSISAKLSYIYISDVFARLLRSVKLLLSREY